MEACVNQYGNIEFLAAAYITSAYNALTEELVTIRLYGPHSLANGGPDTPYEVKWEVYQNRQNDIAERQYQLMMFAKESGQWGYKPLHPDEYEVAFRPGGRKAKGYFILS